LDRLRVYTGATVLVLHHLNAAGTRDRGSTVVHGALDSQFFLRPKTRPKTRKDNDDEEGTPVKDRIVFTTRKQKDLEDDFRLQLVKRVITIDGELEASGAPSTSCLWEPVGQTGATLDAKVLDLVARTPGISGNKLQEELGVNRQTIQGVINRLQD